MATVASPSVVLKVSTRSPVEYWHLLSLDAPTVAALWACALCIAAGVSIPVPSILFIALGTWLIYVADRILDGIKPPDPMRLRERHHFHHAHRRVFGVVSGAVVVVLAVLAVGYLPPQMRLDFSLVLIAALGYFGVVHCQRRVIRRWFPKEMAVGVVFAAAVAVPAWSELRSNLARHDFLAGVALLAALFWLNCVAIEAWESRSGEHSNSRVKETANGEERWLAGAWPAGRVRGLAVAVGIAAVTCVAGQRRSGAALVLPSIYFFILISASILFYLDGAPNRLTPLRLRIAADAALLTPLLILVLPRVLMLSLVFTFGRIG